MQKKLFLPLMGFIIISIILTGCGNNKKVISEKAFINSLKDHGYSINDESDTYKELATSYINASADTENQFLFIDFKKEADADSFFETMHSKLHGIEHNYVDSENLEKSGSNYQYQELTTDDNFYRVIKVEDTILYLEVTIFDKKEAMKIVNELGY